MAGSPRPKARRWPDLAAVGAIVALYAAMPLVVSPAHEVALNDDWIYAGSVRLFLEEGMLRISDMSGGSNVLAQVLWGALFAQLGGGFSFTALRLSTLVAGLGASLALYALLRRLSLSPGRSALGAAIFALNPIVFNLSYTFMTEVPLTALTLLAVLFYLRALEDGRWAWFLGGALFAVAAFWVRQQALFIPAALWLAFLVRRRGEWRRPAPMILGVVLPVGLSLGSYAYYVSVQGDPPLFAAHVEMSQHLIRTLPLAMVRNTLLRGFSFFSYGGLFMLPLLVGLLLSKRGPFPTRGRRLILWLVFWIALAGAGLLMISKLKWSMPFLPNTFTPSGLGPDVGIMRGVRPDVTEEDWVWQLLTAVSVGAGVYLATLLSLRLSSLRTYLASPVGLVALVALVQGAFVILLPSTFLDRALIIMVALWAILALEATKNMPLFGLAAAAMLAGFGYYAAAGTQEYFNWNQARWNTAQALAAEGIPLAEIDVGLEFDGWYHFRVAEAHPQLKKDYMDWWYFLQEHESECTPDPGEWEPTGGRAVFSWLFPELPLRPPYALAWKPVPNYEAWRAVPYESFWGREREIYVLRRTGPPLSGQTIECKER